MRSLLLSLALVCSGCPGPSIEPDAGTDVPRSDAGLDAPELDAPAPDAPHLDAPAPDAPDLDAGTDVGTRPDAGGVPTTLLRPVPGEVTVVQIDLPVGVIPQTGESAIVVGPDGTLVLLDVGNTGHDDDVRAVIEELNRDWVTPARGFPRARGLREVDWIVLSHFHSDHIGGVEDLLTGGSAVTVTRGIVHRGFVDVGAGATEDDYGALCGLLLGSLSHLDVPLCHGASVGRCVVDAMTNPATDCDGLFVGDLGDGSDDASGAPSFLDLGGGARLTFTGADGWMSDGTSAHAMTFPTGDSNEENGRSTTTLLSFGAFRYHWGGDLTGSGEPGEPDVESHLALHAEDAFYGPLGMDVIHAHHHVRGTSSNSTFVELTAPMDGRSRNVVGGVNGAYILSPYAEVLARWGDGARLGTGNVWLTDVATGGGSHTTLVVSGAAVIAQTTGGGTGYWMQAASDPPVTRGFGTVR